MICDMCQNYCYDEEFDEYYCDINLDEDEYLRFLSTVTETKCPYFKNGDEYTIVRKQNQCSQLLVDSVQELVISSKGIKGGL